jgi:glycosyltransferase involved in cell wall biosynthesis
MSREKGLTLLVDAFIALARDHADTTTRLRIGGAATAGDEPGIAAARQKLAAAGLTARVDWQPNLSRENKITFLRSLTLLSVPVQYPEAFGLYVIEAMACGVPVVQPDSAAFPELIAGTNGGLTVEPRNPAALARAWHGLLADPTRLAALAKSARAGAVTHYSSATMATRFLAATAHLTTPPRS